MRNNDRRYIIKGLILITGCLLISACGGKKYSQDTVLIPFPARPAEPSNAQLREYMTGYFTRIKAPPASQYQIERYDINGDKRRDALVLVNFPHKYWCSMYGCTMLILKAHDDSFSPVGGMLKPVRAPVYIAPEQTRGWNDLITRVAGRFSTSAFDSVLRYNGNSYPKSPTEGEQYPEQLNPYRNGIRLFYD